MCSVCLTKKQGGGGQIGCQMPRPRPVMTIAVAPSWGSSFFGGGPWPGPRFRRHPVPRGPRVYISTCTIYTKKDTNCNPTPAATSLGLWTKRPKHCYVMSPSSYSTFFLVWVCLAGVRRGSPPRAPCCILPNSVVMLYIGLQGAEHFRISNYTIPH
jgi:hypothetical protein